jgi:hypothetical protein
MLRQLPTVPQQKGRDLSVNSSDFTASMQAEGGTQFAIVPQ